MSALVSALESYLTVRRTLGYKLITQEQRLRRFVAFMAANSEPAITGKLAVKWARSQCGPASWSSRLATVRSFARHVVITEPRTEIPPSGMFPPQRRPQPHIYSGSEIDDLLRSMPALVRTPYQAYTYQQFLALLATTGLRFSEAANLERRDVDLANGVLTIRGTKFGKSRIVPVHSTAIAALNTYAHVRDQTAERRQSAQFFVGYLGSALRHDSIHKAFILWARGTGLKGEGRRVDRPRIHDLRHTFAVRTLIQWYEAGYDVERRLPLLTTYLGHTHVRDTYWYLSACADLLDHARQRLEASWEGQV